MESAQSVLAVEQYAAANARWKEQSKTSGRHFSLPVLTQQEPSLKPACAGRIRPLLRMPPLYIPLAVLSAFAVLFVAWEVAERHLFGVISIGMHHFLLTVRAAVAAAVAGLIVYLRMRRQHRQVAQTAEQIASLLEAFRTESSARERFHNPHLTHCRDTLNCQQTECPAYESPGVRCWQVVALRGAWRGPNAPAPSVHECHSCVVFQRACPDALTKLGEGFNNMVFLLEEEADQVDRMRAQMVEKEKMVAVGQMASGIAHEIGNPLSSISSVVQMLQRRKSRQPSAEQLDLIQAHIRRISGTVRQLGSLARPTPEHWEQTSIAGIIDDAVRLVAFDRRANGVKIEVTIAKRIPKTFAIRGRLHQVLINLLLNALDAMPNGGTLRVSAEQAGSIIRINVRDTGVGIPEDAGRRIFEPFFTTKGPGEGTGLGLSVSYTIVREHGGRIDFVSTAPEGTTFTVELPVMKWAPDDRTAK